MSQLEILTPLREEEIRPRLKTVIFGKKIHYSPVTGSTNDEAIRRAKEGGEEGEVFLAERQTAGRGRLGRGWESPEGKNLAISFLLRPNVSAEGAVPITLVAAMAIHNVLSSLVSDELKIKWPNDLYLGDRKVAGILSEMQSDSDRIHWVVCGIGIDLNTDPDDFSPEVRETATSLKITTGKTVDRIAVTAAVIEAFEKAYRGFQERGSAEAIAFCRRFSYDSGDSDAIGH